MNAICYVLPGGIALRLMPDIFPPRQTVYRWFARRCDDGTWKKINHHLIVRDRERTGRQASPAAAVTASQGVGRWHVDQPVRDGLLGCITSLDAGFLDLGGCEEPRSCRETHVRIMSTMNPIDLIYHSASGYLT